MADKIVFSVWTKRTLDGPGNLGRGGACWEHAWAQIGRVRRANNDVLYLELVAIPLESDAEMSLRPVDWEPGEDD